MNKLIVLMLGLCVAGCTTETKEPMMNGFYDIAVERISGETIRLDAYKGNVLLIVNTASRCGFTGQYDGLQKLYETYKDQGLVVLGFPSNDFMRQEPGSNEEIVQFCRANYGVTFPMFSKISVKGADQHPLYRFLTSSPDHPEYNGKVSWNFNKFLVSKEGAVVNRFGSRTKPDDAELVMAIEEALK